MPMVRILVRSAVSVWGVLKRKGRHKIRAMITALCMKKWISYMPWIDCGGMTESISTALGHVFAAFADVECPTEIEVSPVKKAEDYQVLLHVPRESLNAEQFSGYLFGVFHTVGGAEDFLYFFPRLLELAAENGTEILRELLFQKSGLAEWRLWRSDRVVAFQAYLTAVIESFSTYSWSEDEMDSWICALSYCVEDLDCQLEGLMSSSEAANHNLIELYESNSETLLKRNALRNPFWPASSRVHDRIVTWFSRPGVVKRIYDIYQSRDL